MGSFGRYVFCVSRDFLESAIECQFQNAKLWMRNADGVMKTGDE